MGDLVFLERAQLDRLRRVATELYREDRLSGDQMRDLAHTITAVVNQAVDYAPGLPELPDPRAASAVLALPASTESPVTVEQAAEELATPLDQGTLGDLAWASVVSSAESVVLKLHARRGDAGRACFSDAPPGSTSGYVTPVARRHGAPAAHTRRDGVVAYVATDPELRRALAWASGLRGEVRGSDLAYALAQAVSTLATRLVAEHLQGR